MEETAGSGEEQDTEEEEENSTIPEEEAKACSSRRSSKPPPKKKKKVVDYVEPRPGHPEDDLFQDSARHIPKVESRDSEGLNAVYESLVSGE